MQKLKKKLLNLITISIITLMLTQILAPVIVFADPAMPQLPQTMGNQDIDKLYNSLSDQQKEGMDKDTFADLIHLNADIGNIKRQGQDGYDEWVNGLVDEYKNSFKPYLDQQGVEKFNGSRVTGNKNGSDNLKTDYREYLEKLRPGYQEYLDENTPEGQEAKKYLSRQEADKEHKEANEYYTDMLTNQDDAEGFIDFWQNFFQRAIVQEVFLMVCGVATKVGDAVINMLQKYMLPCSPTAVAKRDKSDYIEEKLNARDPDAYVIAFGRVDMSTYKPEVLFDQENSVIEIPFIYYTPSTIFSNKVPLFDINFLNKDAQLKNPFFVDENGNYSDAQVEKTKELVEATEKNTNYVPVRNGRATSSIK